MWSQLQQASFGRCVSITLKALLISSSCSDTSQPSGLRSPPHAGQAVSAGDSVRVSRGSEAGSGLRAEDWRSGCGSAGSCCSPSTSAISSCRALMRSSASRTWRAVFSRSFSELLPNCIRCSLATSAFRRLISLAYAATRCESRRLYSAILRMVVCCSCSSALSRAFSSGYEVSITPLYSRLYAYSRAFRPLGMLPVNAFQQHGQLRRRQVDFAVTGHRPDEAATFQPFGKHAQAVPVGPQYLYHVAAPAAEDEQMPAERVGAQRVLHLRRQPVEAAAHVCHACNQPNACACRKTNHGSPSRSSLTSARSNSGVSGPVRLRLPPGSVSLQLMTGGRSADTAPLCLRGGESGSTVTGMSVALMAGSSSPWRCRFRQLNTRLSLTPCSRASSATQAPGSRLSSAMRILNSRGQSGRRFLTGRFVSRLKA
ncbi:hypothetical protein CKS_1640 [Pantoea stewartii subsp. stewartii DC283]|uniref:Uncharacterized protein n=1 Tax=Pantoea stewartii subsp. stewartii DC283 TaxID=660596 RepID=H3RG96_PANSE|nr:hypothetical protein CKS_1640 [Pantoea stewartii subsp. stewartii DC283]